MSTFNSVTLVGYLGGDVDLRALPDGTPVANFRLATDEARKRADGQWDKHPEWHRIVVYGQQATLAQKHLAKGAQCLCAGKLRTRKWNKDGVDHWTTEVVASNVGFLGRAASSSTSMSPTPPVAQSEPPPAFDGVLYEGDDGAVLPRPSP